jgi:ankyrin repeat protein
MHEAASARHCEMIKLLAEHGASVLCKTESGHTPRELLAREKKSCATVELLIELEKAEEGWCRHIKAAK